MTRLARLADRMASLVLPETSAHALASYVVLCNRCVPGQKVLCKTCTSSGCTPCRNCGTC